MRHSVVEVSSELVVALGREILHGHEAQRGRVDAVAQTRGRGAVLEDVPEVRVGARTAHLHTYFDAFRTLKWVHAVRAASLPEVDPGEAVAGLLGHDSGGVRRDLETLRGLEAAECRGDVGAPCFEPRFEFPGAAP